MAKSGESQLLAEFQGFLQGFCETHNGPINKGESLPFRIVPYYITEEELEGECIDLCLQYLGLSKCPHLLAQYVTREAVNDFLTSDLDLCLAEYEGESTKLYQASAVGRGVFSCANVVCQKWTKCLPEFSLQRARQTVSAHAIKNTRRKMEDRHVIVPDVASLVNVKYNGRLSYYAVFDGHGGLDASSYAAAHVLRNLTKEQNFTKDLPQALKQGYLTTDQGFVSKCEREQLRSGTTAVSVMLTDDALHIAWLGDSQAVLVRDGQVVTLMDPHKPEREDEKKRIESLGGCVVFFGAWRVNGSLSVSRAIGDAEHKPYISGEPDVASFSLTGTEDYVILACDGLWDTVSPTDVLSLVYDHLKTDDRRTVAEILVRTARTNGSNDNISVVVVFLRDHIAPPRSSSNDNEIAVAQGESDANISEESQSNDTSAVSNHAVSRVEANNDTCNNADGESGSLPTEGSQNQETVVSNSGSEKSTGSTVKKQDELLKTIAAKRKARRGGRKTESKTGTTASQSTPSPGGGNNAEVEINVSANNNEQSKGPKSLADTPPTQKKPSLKKANSGMAERRKPPLSPRTTVAPKQQTFGSELQSSQNINRAKSLTVSLKPKKSNLQKKNSLPPSFGVSSARCTGNIT